MKFIFIFTLSFASIASTKNFNFHYSGFEGRNRVYLSCSYAKYQTEKFLTQIGAKEISVQCYGGLQNSWFSPIRINASYQIINFEPEDDNLVIKSHFDSNCFFDTRLLSSLLEKQEHLEITRKRTSCFNSDSRYFYFLKFI